jgi:predicted flavoprotein YhiN
MTPTWDVIVIGAGAAGLLAATRAAERGLRVLLLEKNRKPGVKILMSGGTRCNITHATDRRGIETAFREQGRFLRGALAAFGPEDAVKLVEEEGVRTKIEPGGKIFPESDRAADVLQAFLRRLQRSSANLQTQEPVLHIERDGGLFSVTTSSNIYSCVGLIVTTGGQSYPRCGTTGDGYGWGRNWQHQCVIPKPALVPVLSPAPWLHELSGLTLDCVRIRLLAMAGQVPTFATTERRREASDGPVSGIPERKKSKGKTIQIDGVPRHVIDERIGGMLFTHIGMSGPAVLDISQLVPRFESLSSLLMELDFRPESSLEQVQEQLDSLIAMGGAKQVVRLVVEFAPRRLVERLLDIAGIPSELKGAELSRGQRRAFANLLKHSFVPVSGTLGFEKAEVTSGGIALHDVNPATMESRRVPNLYFAGEVLDIDGPIGGYNFQAAFSTGWLAGSKVLGDFPKG